MVKQRTQRIIFVEKITDFFQKGIVLDPDTIHFIDSTFLNPSLNEFDDILTDESNLERESLMELVFSPDEAIQIKLEHVLIDEDFVEDDEKEIIDLLCSKKLNTDIIFPDGRGKLNITIREKSIASFVSKLNILWKPDEQILKALDHIPNKTAVSVRMRNKKVDFSENKINTLCSFLEKADSNDPLFFKCLDYLLDTLDGISDMDDIYETLSQRKHQYIESIRKRQEFAELLAKSNVETLSSQGINAPFIHVDDMRKRIEIIDIITLAVYGKIVYCL